MTKFDHKEQLNINACENCYLSFTPCDRTENGSTCSYCMKMDSLCVTRQLLGLPLSADFRLQEPEYRQLQQERKRQWDQRVEHLRQQVYLFQGLEYQDQKQMCDQLESQLVQMHHQFMEMHQQELKEQELLETPEQREFRELQVELEVEAMLQQLRLT